MLPFVDPSRTYDVMLAKGLLLVYNQYTDVITMDSPLQILHLFPLVAFYLF
jgi:hypothetical protein